MADLAPIGFAVDTKQLEKAIVELSTFNNVAKKVGTSMASSSKIFAGAVAGMSKSIYAMVSSLQSSTVEQVAAAKEAVDFADSVYRAAKAQEALAKSTANVDRAIKGETNSLNNLSKKIDITEKNRWKSKEKSLIDKAVGKEDAYSTNMISRFNTANIAAQFQDVAVTAAMGMNPMTIALQQGTQLAAVLQNVDKPLENLKNAFTQLISSTSLWTIAIVGLSAALLQMVNWVDVGKGSLNLLANGMDLLAEHVETLTFVFMSLIGIWSVFAGGAIATGFSLLIGLFSKIKTLAIAVGMAIKGIATSILATVGIGPLVVGALLTSFVVFEDKMKEIFGESFVEGIKLGVNTAIRVFMTFIESAVAGLSWLKDKIFSIFSDAYEPQKGFLDTITEAGERAYTRDYLGLMAKTGEKLSVVFKKGASAVRDFASGLGEADEKAKKARESWEKLQLSVEDKLAGLRLEKSLIGEDDWTKYYKQEKFDLEKQARDSGEFADSKWIDNRARALADEQVEIDLSNEKWKEQENIIDSLKSNTTSFFQEMRHGLRDGASAWEAFGNAVNSVLDKMLDKMIEVSVNSMFGDTGSSGSGWMSAVGNAIGSYFTGGTWGVSESGGTTVTNKSYSIKAANGGVFTNGIYDSPTMFKFAKGGSFGLMGEAGPEAVMPLTRSRDGSLGVRAEGLGGGTGDVTVNVYNNSDSQATVNQRETERGIEFDVIIDKTVADKMNQHGSYSNSALLAFNNRQLITR